MSRPTAADVLGATTLLVGSEEFLVERAISTVRETVRSADDDADLSDLEARDLGAGALAEIASPSLFATARCVVVRELEQLPADAVEPMLAYVGSPAPDVALVLHHSGGPKAKALLDRVRQAAPADGLREQAAVPLKRWDLTDWMIREFGSYDVKVTGEAAEALVDAVGDDLRGLAAAADQLAADFAGQPVTEEVVRRYYAGRAEVKGFTVADAAIDGKAAQALEQLRWAFAARVDPVLITSAVASGLRSLARFMTAPRGLRQADLAREVGVPPWKLKVLRVQSRGWSHRGLAAAIQAAAVADADVKGGAGDRMWVCERLVISVLRARGQN